MTLVVFRSLAYAVKTAATFGLFKGVRSEFLRALVLKCSLIRLSEGEDLITQGGVRSLAPC